MIGSRTIGLNKNFLANRLKPLHYTKDFRIPLLFKTLSNFAGYTVNVVVIVTHQHDIVYCNFAQCEGKSDCL